MLEDGGEDGGGDEGGRRVDDRGDKVNEEAMVVAAAAAVEVLVQGSNKHCALCFSASNGLGFLRYCFSISRHVSHPFMPNEYLN